MSCLFVCFLAEPSVRAELMEQVPHVAMYCHEEKDEHQWMHLVPSFLLPLVVRYLTDVNNQVHNDPSISYSLLSSNNPIII